MSTAAMIKGASPDIPLECVPEEEIETTGWLKQSGRFVRSGMHWIFGLISLILVLSIAATLPLIQFLSLGYFLEATARIIRSGRLRDGFVGIPLAARIGSVLGGTFFCSLPIRFFSSLWYSSFLLNGDTLETRGLRLFVFLLALATVIHIAWATFRGGKIRHFLWPAPLKLYRRLRQGGIYTEASNRLLAFTKRLRLGHLFSLGWRGFLGASLYLFLPVTMMALAPQIPEEGVAGLVAFAGGIALCLALVYVPFAQSELAVTHRFRSQFQLSTLRRQFRHAPVAHWFALVLTLLLALPLYLLKAELIPREAAWLPSLVFVTFMYPARLMVGWAVARAKRRKSPRHWLFRWSAWLGLFPVAAIYALIVYGTQFTSWYGPSSLYEQHAFLVPVPFLGY